MSTSGAAAEPDPVKENITGFFEVCLLLFTSCNNFEEEAGQRGRALQYKVVQKIVSVNFMRVVQVALPSWGSSSATRIVDSYSKRYEIDSAPFPIGPQW